MDSEGGFVEGGTVGLRVRSGWWEVGASEYLRVKGDEPSMVTMILLDRLQLAGASSYGQPEDVDTSSTLLWVSWGPAGEVGFWGAPRVVMGVEGRVVARRMYTADPQAVDTLASEVSQFTVSPAVGFAYDLRLSSPVGARLTLLERARIGRDVSYTGDGYAETSRLFFEPVVAFELSWSL